MRIYSFIITLIVILTLSHYQSSKCQIIYPPDCYDQYQGCSDWILGGTKVLKILDLNCPIKYCYWYRTCTNPDTSCLTYPIKQIFIEWFFIDEGDTACTELLQRIYPQWPSKDFVDIQWLANVYKDGYRTLTFEIFKEFFSTLEWDDQEPYLCIDNPCEPNACSPAEYHFSLAACAYVCAVEAEINGHYGTSYQVNYCNPDSVRCCTIVRKYCYCQATNDTIFFEDFDQIRNAYCDTSMQISGCTGRIFDCYLSCQE